METLRSFLSGKAGRLMIVLLPIIAGVVFLMACSTSSERNAGGPAGAEVGTTAAQESAAEGYQVAQRGEDFSVHEKVREAFDKSGSRFWVTNQYTQLENGLNYNENGQWRQSEDLIEPFPGLFVFFRLGTLLIDFRGQWWIYLDFPRVCGSICNLSL